MIKEQFVPYEITLLLRDKGFNELCRSFWLKSNDGNTIWTSCSVENSIFEWCTNRHLEKYNKNGKDFVACPTYQMACDWILENYGLYICILFDKQLGLNDKCYYINIDDTFYGTSETSPCEDVFFETKYDALNAAILYVLKEKTISN